MSEKELKKIKLTVGIVLGMLVYIAGVYYHHNYRGSINPSWMLWNKEYKEFSESYGTKPYSDDYFAKEKNKIRERQPSYRRPPSIWKSLTYPIIPAYMVFLFITKSLREFIFGTKDKEQDEDDDDDKDDEDEKIQD